MKNIDEIKYRESVLPYACEWAIGSEFGRKSIYETPAIRRQTFDLVKILKKIINIDLTGETLVSDVEEEIFKEWSKSGHIIPGKRCIILEKRK